MANRKTGKPNSFQFYDGYSEAIEQLPNNQMKALFVWDFYQYGAWGIEPTFDWAEDAGVKMAVQMAWNIAVPSLDKSVKNSKNGKKGGRPKGSKNKPKLSMEDETITQAAWAAEQLSEPIPDDVVAMIEPAFEEVEVF